MAEIKVEKPLEKPEWEDRINNPEKYPFIQNKDGSITIPDVLIPYMGNIEKISKV